MKARHYLFYILHVLLYGISFLASTFPLCLGFLTEVRRLPQRGRLSFARTAWGETASIVVAGSDPDRPKICQDACFVSHFHQFTCLGVMDGHGKKGHELTQYLKTRLPLRIQTLLQEGLRHKDAEALDVYEDTLIELAHADASEYIDSSFKSVLRDAFHLVQLDAERESNVPSARSGTTCVVALIDHSANKMHVAQAGDSAAIWTTLNKEVQSTTGTTTSIGSERERIEKAQGRIDAQGNVFYGPQGISMTRSLGNAVMLRAGVIPTPVITHIDIIPSLLVLASDGVWDVLSHETTLEIVQNADNLQSGLCRVAEGAQTAWQSGLMMEVKIDDITLAAYKQ
jgi:serine/threonine protein phosphatase PrpC